MITEHTQQRTDKLIEEQVRKWELEKSARKKRGVLPKPVITISRQPGSGSHLIAPLIAEEFEIDLFDDKIINEVAESARMSEKVIASLDEKMRSTLDNWIQFLKTTRWMMADKYFFHLTKVIGTAGRHGGAVIIGRGANLILPPDETLRIRLIAPMEVKIQNLSEGLNISVKEAERKVIQMEAERKAFIKKLFKVDIDDPVYYDLIINTQYVGMNAIIDIVKATMKQKKLPSRRTTDAKSE